MAYYFAVETEKNSFNAINVKRCRHYFETPKYYDEPLAYTLKEIDKVTTTFKDEEELKRMLLRVYSLQEEDLNKPLAIFYIDDKEKRLVKGNILYEDSRSMLEEPNQVIEYIKNRIKENDTNFLMSLIDNLDDSLVIYQLNKIITLIEMNQTNNSSNIKSIIKEDFITTVIDALIHDYYIDDKGTTKFKKNINYEKLHIIVSTISKYQLSLKNNISKKKIKKNTSN